MPRVARIYLEEGVFHILTRGNNGQWVFKDNSDFHVYKEILGKIKEEQPFNLYHYCLMNNHVHLIIETSKKTQLSKLMKRVNLMYYHYYKKKYGYVGHFWQDRFKSLLIQRNEYLLACGLYIERNPVRAKVVKAAEKYPYSSYTYYAYGKADKLIERDPVFDEELNGGEEQKQSGYRGLMLEGILDIKGGVLNRSFLGSSEFVNNMETRFKVINTRLKRGRPCVERREK